MIDIILASIQTLNELLTAGIAITAFSLLLYAFTFNLRDRVARSFAIILMCVVVVFVGDTISSTTVVPKEIELWQRFQWIGIIFLPAAYLHFSDALLATTGKPSRGRRKLASRFTYLLSFAFLLTLPTNYLVGPLVQSSQPAPHLERTWLTWVFTAYYAAAMVWSWVNFVRAHNRTVTSTSRRRMNYLVLGSLAPALGSYPYLLLGPVLGAVPAFLFWPAVLLSNAFVYVLLILMAYAVAFFGVPWPDRVVKRRLVKWLMRGPVSAILVLGVTTLVRRIGQAYGIVYSALIPISMAASILIIEHIITLIAPIWERWLFHGGDRSNVQLLTTLEERLLTSGDLRQFLESVLAAVCDRLQVNQAFIVTFGPNGLETVVTAGEGHLLDNDLSQDIIGLAIQNGIKPGLFTWGNFWLVPLFEERGDDEKLLGLLGAPRTPEHIMDQDQREALSILARRAALALEDRSLQQQVVSSLESLTPQVDMIQQLRAASRYDSSSVLDNNEWPQDDISRHVKDALSHYWGGPKLTQSPLLKLQIVQDAVLDHEGSPANALRAILNKAIEQTRPEGERRFTGEWILYNILEMKFLEGRKVRDIAGKLAMSEADLYRKQRVAIEAVAAAIVEMEEKAREEDNNHNHTAQSEKLL